MKRKLAYAVTLLSSLIVTGASADGFALGAKLGTLGLGVEGTMPLSERLNLRAGINSYSRSFDETASDINYRGDLNLKSGALLLDWHPGGGTFRLSGGLLYNQNDVQLRATPTGNVTIGGTTYTPAQAGNISGDVTFKKAAPYVGLGWADSMKKTSGFGLTAEIGLMFQGAPDVALRSSNPAVTESDLRREEQDAEDDLDDLKIYPVLSIGFSYRF